MRAKNTCTHTNERQHADENVQRKELQEISIVIYVRFIYALSICKSYENQFAQKSC